MQREWFVIIRVNRVIFQSSNLEQTAIEVEVRNFPSLI